MIMYELYSDPEIEKIHQEIVERRLKIVELLKRNQRPMTKSYSFKDKENLPMPLSAIFEKKNELLIIHNMGKSCRYCTLWADGINGIIDHLQDRTAFALISPDPPDIQREFASSRGWKFPMYSDESHEFSIDMGFGRYKDEKYYAMPGFSTFRKEGDGTIIRVGYDEFGPGDMYSPLWHFFALLPDGEKHWEPQYWYE
jgi:predicted dithiol-disulfide oxidoreductase (DUF899 family)